MWWCHNIDFLGRKRVRIQVLVGQVVAISCLRSGLVSKGTWISFVCSIKRERIWDQRVGCDRLVQGATCRRALAAMHRHVRGAMRALGRFPLQSGKTLVHTKGTQFRYIRTLGEHPREGFGVLNLFLKLECISSAVYLAMNTFIVALVHQSDRYVCVLSITLSGTATFPAIIKHTYPC